MSDTANNNRGAWFLGAGVAIAAAISMVRKAPAAVASTIVGLSQNVMDLLAAMAQGVGSIDGKLDEILSKMGSGGSSGNSYPPNADTIHVIFVNCPNVQPQSYPLPDLQVADGLTVLIEAPTTNARAVYIGGTQPEAGQTLSAKPLIPGQNIAIPVKNTKTLWVGALSAGDGVYVTAPQRQS